ncbi:putative transmembrane protein [Mycobacterium kansasii 732]|nr:putative transmembrane protein [Mycobacterium kansasii 732]
MSWRVGLQITSKSSVGQPGSRGPATFLSWALEQGARLGVRLCATIAWITLRRTGST